MLPPNSHTLKWIIIFSDDRHGGAPILKLGFRCKNEGEAKLGKKAERSASANQRNNRCMQVSFEVGAQFREFRFLEHLLHGVSRVSWRPETRHQ